MVNHPNDFTVYDSIPQCVTLGPIAKKKGRHPKESDLGVLDNAAIVVDKAQQKILWIGFEKDLPKTYLAGKRHCASENEIWLPQLVECHTHLIYAGSRHRDYALRSNGLTYAEVAAQGGGILFTMAQTRAASSEALIERALCDLKLFEKTGVGTVEIKSGYGLTLESELKSLECIKALQGQTNLQLVPTFLAGHAVPPEFKGRADEYVQTVCREWIPVVSEKKLATYFDVFIEEGYFNLSQGRKMAEVAADYGMRLKLHCDQFTDMGATLLGVELLAQSCDHLDRVSESSIKKLAQTDTVAVLCPGASFFTGTPYPPARRLIDEGARVALSTDCNPGSCPSRNLPLMTTFGCSQMKMTVAEVITAVTYNAAAALGLEEEIGSLEVGKKFAVTRIEAPSYEAFPYRFGERG